ncbi:MAG: B12-binding domain-containing radical SAM protein [Puniceicoccaceae bacterium]
MNRIETQSPSGPVSPVRNPGILFSSVFGPFARDDEYGSRAINPMELYQNQVTRVQGPFSLRMFHRSWGLMLIRENIGCPSTLLDFPTRDQFIEELERHPYDFVAISAIPPNYLKVREMCRLVRLHRPGAGIIIGGHISGVPDLRARTGADHVVRGEGVRWMREFLGEDPDRPIRHPRILSGVGTRTMGMRLSEKPGEVAATLIPSVGCPMGCNFCATSAMFGGKGRFIDFYKSGDELFEVMRGLERDLKVRSFFVMDENFLFHRRRALRLLERMKEHRKSWSLYVFSSANVLTSYKMEELVGLGVSWVWMGLEGKESRYSKLSGADTLSLVRDLRSHGISVLGSTIIGLEEHSPENLPEAIEYAVRHDTEFHQFMLYTPVPGTPLFEEHRGAGTLVDPTCGDSADAHGQLRFVHRHPKIPPGMETGFLKRAFERDFEVNGPSVLRMARTLLEGWKRYGKCADPRIRERFRREAEVLPVRYAAAIAGALRWFRDQPGVRGRLETLLREIKKEFGLRARLASAIGGIHVYRCLKAEDRRLREGWTIEPPVFRESSLAG